MITKTTFGVKISVEPQYLPDVSNPEKSQYFFSYRITIENLSDEKIKLISRHWYIFDSIIEYSEVEGEGVVGQQPIISPGESFTYESSCNIQSEIGSMHGLYMMENQNNKNQFEVEIPKFLLVVPYKMN